MAPHLYCLLLTIASSHMLPWCLCCKRAAAPQRLAAHARLPCSKGTTAWPAAQRHKKARLNLRWRGNASNFSQAGCRTVLCSMLVWICLKVTPCSGWCRWSARQLQHFYANKPLQHSETPTFCCSAARHESSLCGLTCIEQDCPLLALAALCSSLYTL